MQCIRERNQVLSNIMVDNESSQRKLQEYEEHLRIMQAEKSSIQAKKQEFESWFICSIGKDINKKLEHLKIDRGLHTIEIDRKWPLYMAKKYYMNLNGLQYGDDRQELMIIKHRKIFDAPCNVPAADGNIFGHCPVAYLEHIFNNGESFVTKHATKSIVIVIDKVQMTYNVALDHLKIRLCVKIATRSNVANNMFQTIHTR